MTSSTICGGTSAGLPFARANPSAMKGALQSGATYLRTVQIVQEELEAGIETALGELKRAMRITKLDRNDLRQLTVQALPAHRGKRSRRCRFDPASSMAKRSLAMTAGLLCLILSAVTARSPEGVMIMLASGTVSFTTLALIFVLNR
jgi:hypothetical protein